MDVEGFTEKSQNTEHESITNYGADNPGRYRHEQW
jgi:hypothetical protein